jgi:hypothetical protein
MLYLETAIIPVLLCGCKMPTLKVRLEHDLRVYENRVLRRIFVLKRHEIH